MKTILAKAIAFASEKHMGQFDRGGMPYILHPLKVMHYLKSADLELMAIAVLHDVVEDCDVTYRDLLDIGMTERIVAGVQCMTKIAGETHDEYMEKIKFNKDAIRVKLCDLHHNSDVSRLKGVTEKDIRRIEKYHKMYKELEEVLK